MAFEMLDGGTGKVDQVRRDQRQHARLQEADQARDQRRGDRDVLNHRLVVISWGFNFPKHKVSKHNHVSPNPEKPRALRHPSGSVGLSRLMQRMKGFQQPGLKSADPFFREMLAPPES